MDYSLIANRGQSQKQTRISSDELLRATLICLLLEEDKQLKDGQIQSLSTKKRRAQKRTDKRLYISTKDGLHSDFAAAMSMYIF